MMTLKHLFSFAGGFKPSLSKQACGREPLDHPLLAGFGPSELSDLPSTPYRLSAAGCVIPVSAQAIESRHATP